MSGIDAAESVAVAQRLFGARISARTEGAQPIVRAAGAVRYLDDHTVAPSAGGKLLMSATPLRHRAENGRRIPIDLRLRRTGNGWAPRSAPVDVAIAERLDAGVTVAGTTLTFGAEVSPQGRVLGANSVVYPEIAKDTDAVAATTPAGGELFAILRSEHSPERQEIEVELPRGGAVRATDGGGAEVVGADGRAMLSISAPQAEDVSGAPVPVTMKPSADGRSLLLRTPHRDRDVAYPVLVDPVVTPVQDGSGRGWWYAGHSEGLEHWSVVHAPGTGAAFSPRNTCYEPVSCYSPFGLYVYGFAGSNYAPGAYAGFQAVLPAERTAYFSRVQFLNATFNRRGDGAPAPFLAAGIMDTVNGSWTGLTTTSWSFSNATLDVPATTGVVRNGKRAFFGMFVDAWRTLPAWEDAYAGGVVFEVTDPEAPTVSAVRGAGGPSQSGWVRGATSIEATATDPGLGVHQIAIAIPGLLTPGGGSVGYAHGCTGRIGDECPTSYTRTINWDSARMPNGVNQIGLWATDAGQRVSNGSGWRLKVDNEQPQLALSGSLYDARGTNVVGGGDLTLDVTATDGGGSAVRSGVRSIAIAIDGDAQTTTQSCAVTTDSCPLTADRTIGLDSLEPGSHEIVVTVVDRAGNERQSSFSVNRHPTSWEYGGENRKLDTPQEIAALEAALAAADERGRTELLDGLAPGDRVRLETSRDDVRPELYEISRPGNWVTDRSRFFDFGARDIGSGLRSLKTAAPAAPGWEGRGDSHMLNGCVSDDGITCVPEAHVRSVVGNLPNGRNVVEVTAVDANGNEVRGQYHVLVDSERPQLYEINRPGSWITDRNLFFDFGAGDGASGIVELRTQAVGQPGWEGRGTTHTLRSNCGDGIAIQCDPDAHVRSVVGNLAEGRNTVEVIARDAAGNTEVGQYHVLVDTRDPEIYEINRPGHWVNDSNAYFDFGAGDGTSGLVELRTQAVGQPGWEGRGRSHMLNNCGDGISVQCVGDAHVRSVVGNLPSGEHTIEVIASDAAGRTKVGQYHLPVDKEQPTATVSGGLWSDQPAGITGGDLHVSADDGHSGVTSIQLYERLSDGTRRGLAGTHRDDAECPGYGCDPRGMTLGATIDLGALGAGAHQLEIDIWDRAGNRRTISREVVYRTVGDLPKRAILVGSASDPETYSWTPQVPAGYHLGLADNGTRVNVLNQAGNVAATLATAYASDGETDVAMRYRLQGSTVLIDVPHRGSGAEYPVVVDTSVDRWDENQDDQLSTAMALLPGDDGQPMAGAAAGYDRTDAEKSWCNKNNSFCVEFLLDQRKAFRLQDYLYDNLSPANRSNAFLHGFWTGMMVTSAAKRGGGYRSKGLEYAMAHESDSQVHPDAEVRAHSDMDVHNNARGYQYAYTYYRVSDETMCNAILNRADIAVYRSPTTLPSTWPAEMVFLQRGATRTAGHGCGPA